MAAGLAQLLCSAVLALSFGLLYQRRLAALIGTFAVQGWVLAAAVGWQGWAQRSVVLGGAAVLVLGAAGLALPVLLRRAARRSGPTAEVVMAPGVFPGMALAAGLVAVSVLVVLPAARHGPVPAREGLALALSVLLLGQLMMLTRRGALARLVGLLSMGNGLLLGALGAGGLPVLAALPVAAVVLAGMAAAGVVFQAADAPGEGRR